MRSTDELGLNPRNSSPLHVQIAQRLMQQVESGAIRRGVCAAPSESLAKKLGVSAVTVEKAYEWLGACGTLTRDPVKGWKVATPGKNGARGAAEKNGGRLAKLVDDTLRSAAESGIDPMAFAEATMRRAASIRQRIGTRNLVFIEVHPEYVDGYVSELRRELSDLDVKIHGVLTSLITGTLDRRRADAGTLAQAEYVLTTVCHAEFVRAAVAHPRHRVIALSHALKQESLYRIVSLRAEARLGVIISPVDTAATILRTVEYYRDEPSGSIPFAVVTDTRALEKLLAETDVVAYTPACIDQKSAFHDSGREAILLQFVPDHEAIRKVRALLATSALESESRWSNGATPK